MDAMQFLDKAAKAKRQPLYALAGDEDFLKRRVRDTIVATILGDADPAFAVSNYPAEKLDFSTVRNDLDTLPFLGPCRIVIVEDADEFVTAHRAKLEEYAAHPSSAGVLVLEVKSFPETTRLARPFPAPRRLPARRLMRTSCRPGASAGPRAPTAKNSTRTPRSSWSNWSATRWGCSIRNSRNWRSLSEASRPSRPTMSNAW